MYKVRLRLDRDGCWYDHELNLTNYELAALIKIHEAGMLKICWIGQYKRVEHKCCGSFSHEYHDDVTKRFLNPPMAAFDAPLI